MKNIYIDESIPECIEQILSKHQFNLNSFVQELRDAGVNPSPKYFGGGSDSLTIIAAGIPVTIGHADYSQDVKQRLARLGRIERDLLEE